MSEREKEKQAWRREVASKCLIALYGGNADWDDTNILAKAIVANVDALDKALEEETTKKCLYCGKEVPSNKMYCNFSCYTKDTL
jgi:hypothetical protein